MKKQRFILVLLALACAVTAASCAREESSVGIIGGADGPTAIFISSSAEQTNGDDGVSGDGSAAYAARALKKPAVIILSAAFAAVVLYRLRKTKAEPENKRPEQKPPDAF